MSLNDNDFMKDPNFIEELKQLKVEDGIKQTVKLIKQYYKEFICQGFDKKEALGLSSIILKSSIDFALAKISDKKEKENNLGKDN